MISESRVRTSFETVGPCHQQVLSSARVADHAAAFRARKAATESNAFSIRNALWSRTEDDLLVQTVAKHSTSETLFRDWSEVAWELPGRSEQQCIERYKLADTVVTLTNHPPHAHAPHDHMNSGTLVS